MNSSEKSYKDKSLQPKLVLLDIYETILDMREVQKHVNALLKSKRGYMLWFELLMQYSFVDNSTVQFHDFPSIADATLRMTAQMLDKRIENNEVDDILKLLEQLPLKEGVQKGLSQLNDLGIRVNAFTNSPESIVRRRMERTGLISYFENIISAEQVGKYKPALEVYRWAAKISNLNPSEMLVVSAHGWDIAGAENAGMQTAYLQQEYQLLYPLAPQPDFICKNLVDLAGQLQAAKTG